MVAWIQRGAVDIGGQKQGPCMLLTTFVSFTELGDSHIISGVQVPWNHVSLVYLLSPGLAPVRYLSSGLKVESRNQWLRVR